MLDGEEIVNACVRAVDASRWYEAGTLLTRLEADVALPSDETSWLAIIIKSTKANRNMLRMMQRASRFVDTQNDAVFRGRLKDSPLSHVDVLMRAIEVDRKKGLALLDTYLNGGGSQSYRRLVAQYEQIRAKAISLEGHPARTRGTTGEFRKICLDLIHGETMLDLYAQICEQRPSGVHGRVWKGAHPLTSPYATIRRPSGVHLRWELHHSYDPRSPSLAVDGVECFMRYSDDDYDVVRKRLLQAASEATLYDTFWLFIPEVQPSGHVFALDGEDPFAEIDFYVSLYKKLAVPNLGLVVVDPAAGQAERVLLPWGAPKPDRRHLWNTMTRQYLA